MLENWSDLKISCEHCSTVDSCRMSSHPSEVRGLIDGRFCVYDLCAFECAICRTRHILRIHPATQLPLGDVNTALLRLADISEAESHRDLTVEEVEASKKHETSEAEIAACSESMRTDICE